MEFKKALWHVHDCSRSWKHWELQLGSGQRYFLTRCIKILLSFHFCVFYGSPNSIKLSILQFWFCFPTCPSILRVSKTLLQSFPACLPFVSQSTIVNFVLVCVFTKWILNSLIFNKYNFQRKHKKKKNLCLSHKFLGPSKTRRKGSLNLVI